MSFVWAACGATCALRCGMYIGWTFDEVMLDGDLAWEACARNSGFVKVIEKHLRGGRRAGTACAKRICRSVCVCVCVRGRWICSSRMKMMTAKQREETKQQTRTTKQFQICSDSVVSRKPRRRRACRIVIRLSSGRRHVRIAMRDLYWSADRSGGWSRNQRAGV